MSLFKQISQKIAEVKQKDGTVLQTVAKLTPEQKKNVYFHVKSRLVEQGPETAEELWNYVRVTYGFRIPLTATTEDSNAPFEWFYDYYFDKHTQTFAIGSRGGGKALALDTPIKTTHGWDYHGNLAVGDYVYGADCQPTKVTEVHDIQHGKKCYSVLIEGEEIVADAEHLWPVLVSPNTFELSYRTILTTEQCWDYYHNKDMYLHIGVEGLSFRLDDIFEIDSVPVRCITVEAEDHLYLVGKSLIPTHNTYPATFGIDMKCRFRQNYEVVHVAAEKAQAKVSQGYIAGFYKDEYLKDFFARKPSAYAAEWRSGSTWRTVTASRSGISGSHPNQLTLDEIEFWPVDAIEQSFAVPQERNGYPAQHHMFSTRQRCLPGYTRVLTEDGPMKISRLVNTKYAGKVKSWNTQTLKWEWKHVTNWYRNGSSRVWYKVYLEYTGLGRGCELVATGNHQVYENSTTKKPLEEFKAGESLCLPSWVPDSTQKQVLYGTLLGDGCVDKGGHIRIEHGSNQLDYLNWKSNCLGDLPYSTTYSKKRLHTLHLHTNCAYTHRLRREWYPNGLKRIPDYVWDELDVLGLAIWIMDDGCVMPVGSAHGGIYITLFALHFNEHERTKATEWFAKKGVVVTWKTYQRSRITGEPLYHIRISKQDAWNVLAMISPYLSAAQHMGQGALKSKGRKNWVAKPLVPTNKNEGFELVPIKLIEKVTSLPTGMYDIEVEDNHNFLNGSNILVSNSYGSSNYLTNQIEQGKKQIKLYKWTIFETMQRCPSCVCMKGDRVVSNPEQACALWEDCIKWNQLVQTWNRGPVQIKDLTTQDKVYSWSDGKLTVNKVTKVWSKGVRKTYAVTTLHRKRIEGTYEHPVLTAQYEKLSYNRGRWLYEWKPLGSLTKKDLVVTAKELGTDEECREVNGIYIDDDLLYLIGLYVGDGTLQKHSLTIAEFEEDRVASIQRIVKDRWNANSSTGSKSGVKISSLALVKDFAALGFTKKLSFEKTLPAWLWNLSKEQIKTFIAGYVDSDGCVQKHGVGVTTVIASTSYVVLQQVRNLCLFVGYTHIGSINLTKRKFPLIIRGKALNPDVIKPIYSFEFRTGNKKSIGYLYNNIPSLQKFLSPDDRNFRLETVLSIEETGEHEVYDISVENDHNFIAEGVVVHNCKGIRGLKSSGWVPREEVIKYRSTLDRKEWEVQYLCTRPSSHGLVLYNFEHAYASPADLDAGNFLKWEYTPELPLYAVHDPAEGQKSVFLFFQIFNGRIFFFDELVQQPCATVSEVKKALWQKLRKEGYPDPVKIIVDPHRTDAGTDWMMGTKTGEEIERSYVVEYPDMTTGYAEIEKGLGLLRTFICNGSQRRLYINPEKCPSLDTATREHHYRIPKGGELTDDAPPDKAFKDECDTIRYAVIWGTQFGGLKTFDLTIHLLG